MRISGFEIRNYKGVELAEANGIAAEPLVLISGKNGTGKSLVLEAIALVLNARWNEPAAVVGPYGDAAEVQIDLELSADEVQAVNTWNGSVSPGSPGITGTQVRFNQIFTKAGAVLTGDGHTAGIDAIRNTEFQRAHAWSRVDFLPSVRILPGGQAMSVEPSMLDPQRLAQERQSSLDSYLQNRAPSSMGNVYTYLATTDYVDLMALRDGGNATGEFRSLVAPFSEATGKTINPPRAQSDFSIKMQVGLPGSTITHPVDGLSSGEQELLSVSYFVRRANAAGGVLLIDEPEQHLHPTLQSAVLRQVAAMSPDAQVIAVTHSVNILASATTSAILTMNAPGVPGESQLSALTDDAGRIDLISELGLTAADLIQSDFIVVVEGGTDESLLRLLYPAETARAAFVVAGNVYEVMKVCSGLQKIDPVVPYICLRDRDFLDDVARNALMEKNIHLHVWQRRMIENELLQVDLILECLRREALPSTKDEVVALLTALVVDTDKSEAVFAAVDERLRNIKPIEGMPSLPKGVERHRESYRYLARQAEARVEQFDLIWDTVVADIDNRWDEEWLKLIDGKALLDRLGREMRVPDIRASLANAYVGLPAARPVEMAAFGAKLRAMTRANGSAEVVPEESS